MLTPVFKSADPEFNYRAADLATKLVMSMEEDEAREFATQVVANVLWDDIEKNQKTLQRHLNSVVAKRVERVAKAADSVVSKRDGADFGTSLVEIAKATKNPYDYGYVFRESDFNRDPSTGRFGTKVKYRTDKPVSDKIANRIPNMPSVKGMKGMSSEQKARYQQGYQQIATFLDSVQNSGLAGDTRMYATVRDTDLGRTYVTEVSGTQVPKIDPRTEEFLGIEARPTSLSVGGASFGLVSALGGGPHRAGQVGATAHAVDSNLRSFADDWTSAGMGNNQSSNQRLYDRVETGSRFLGQIAPAGSKLQIAAAFGEFAGKQGPQAEKVLGPHARTAMYRYRGTEKTPDKDLVEPYNRARSGGYSFDALSVENQRKVRALQRSAVTRYKNSHGGKITPEEAEQVRAVVLRRAFNVSQQDAALAAEQAKTRSFVTAQTYLAGKVPNNKLYDLQLKSGHTPPSEGVIIDKTGKIVTQAIGYGDDHYLPFNLKNLKGLRGGEYIRTRSVGGPTTEDIYTGLVSGAHRLTVVSRSGTFTVTFDDTFRGTRRYNDKAGRMVGRYGKILDAIKSEQVERQPLDPEVRASITHDVETEIGSFSSPRDVRREIDRRIAEYKENPTLTRSDEEAIERRVAQIGGDERTRNTVRAQMRNDLLESKAYNFRLNGDGYAAAISALEEQFPYYLTSTFRPTREGRYEGAIDRGYVKPRFNRPSGALEGYYDTSINGEGTTQYADGRMSGKHSADRMDYQNARGRLTRVEVERKEEGKLPSGAEILAGGVPVPKPAEVKAPTPAEVMADRIATAAARQTLADRAVALQSQVKLRTEGADRGPLAEVLGMSPDDFRAWLASPANQEKFDALLPVIRNQAAALQVEDLLTAYGAAKGEAGGVQFSRASHMTSVPDTPYSFPGAPYLRGGNVDKKMQELHTVANRSHIPDFGRLDALEFDSDFKEALRTTQGMRRISDQLRQFSDDPAERASYLRELQKDNASIAAMTDEQKKLLNNPDKVDQMIEDINRAWALRKLIGPVEKLETSRGTLAPTGATISEAPPAPAKRAEAPPPATPTSRAMVATYKRALSDYSSRMADVDPDFAEQVNDLVSQFDIAQHAPEASRQRDFNAANAALMDLQQDYPQYRQGMNDAIMQRIHREHG